MKAEAIRTLASNSVTAQIDGSLPDDQLQAFALLEIAAQLAELNERLKYMSIDFSQNEPLPANLALMIKAVP